MVLLTKMRENRIAQLTYLNKNLSITICRNLCLSGCKWVVESSVKCYAAFAISFWLLSRDITPYHYKKGSFLASCMYFSVSVLCRVWVSVQCLAVLKNKLTLDWQVEVKNLNSFSAINRAIEFEILRQVLLHNEGQSDQIVQETRLWDEGSQVNAKSFFMLVM